MGDIKRKRRSYSKPRQLFDRTRIDQENIVLRRYGLKNKKEIWKGKSLVSKFRRRAKDLISKDAEEQQEFFNKLNNLGIKVVGISDILALSEDDLFGRRLQTFVVKKGLASTPKQARQLIVHKHILVDGKIVNIPSFWVTAELENKIEIKITREKPIIVEEKEESAEETTQDKPDAPKGVPPAEMASAQADKVGKETVRTEEITEAVTPSDDEGKEVPKDESKATKKEETKEAAPLGVPKKIESGGKE
jgi:small subunit ribosomal protein S4